MLMEGLSVSLNGSIAWLSLPNVDTQFGLLGHGGNSLGLDEACEHMAISINKRRVLIGWCRSWFEVQIFWT